MLSNLIFALIGFTSQAGSTVQASNCQFVDDFSRMNRTCVSAIYRPKTIADIRKSLEFARKNGLKVSLAGDRHTMAGQTIAEQGVYLDMKGFNQILSFDPNRKLLTVQSGATWKQVQQFLDPSGYAVDVMQDYNVFTVGGSLSVNAYGWNTNSTNIISNVQSVKIMLADGSVVDASRTHNSELFSLAIGGYGLFGVILEATLQVTENEAYELKTYLVRYKDFPDFYDQHLAGKHYLIQDYFSLTTENLLEEIQLFVYEKTNKAKVAPLREKKKEKTAASVMGWLVRKGKNGKFWKKAVWLAQSKVLPALLESPVSRNQVMSRPLPQVANYQKGESLVIQAYLIPKQAFADFIDQLRINIQKHNPPVITTSVSHLKRSDEAFLSTGSGQDKFGVTLSFVQKVNSSSEERMVNFAREMIDEVTKFGGTLYLAHRMAYTKHQLVQLYPQVDQFFGLKRHYDPSELFSNKFYERYGK